MAWPGGSGASPVSWVLGAGDGVSRIQVGASGAAPVFVLSMARSGSTLLRFILDSHPELACPPETNVGQVCLGLARLWDLLDPSADSAGDEWRPNAVLASLSDDAAGAIRAAVDGVYGRYLARYGKRRWCDKSLDSARLAGLLARVFPEAQFVCLYRHCLDVVVSAIETAPWGLSGYGFDSYVAASPGNMVLAAARCWLDQTRAIIEFQEKNPDRCHGVRYEDLVTAPEQVAGELFAFLGLAPVPGITEAAFSVDHDMRGPADHKIWFTSGVSAASLGQGARVPVRMLPADFLTGLNETLDQLGYRQVDELWRAAAGPADPRAGTGALPGRPADAAADEVAGQIADRLASVPGDRLGELTRRWPAAAGQALVIAVQSAGGTGPGHRWKISRGESGVAVSRGEAPGATATTVAAAPATWRALLDGRANFAAEQRAGRLRVLDSAVPQPGPAADHRAELRLIAHLLGLAAGSHRPGRDPSAGQGEPGANRAAARSAIPTDQQEKVIG